MTNTTPTYIIFQAYGLKGILDELIYSVATLKSFGIPENTTFVVYTDNEEYLRKFMPENTQYVFLSEEKRKLWAGEFGFHHRIKIEMILDFIKNHDGNFLYLDTDTYFVKSAGSIFEGIEKGKVFMHTKEGVLSAKKNLTLKKMYRFVTKKTFHLDGKELVISGDSEMWNAGLLGFNSSHKKLIEKTLSLTDNMYGQYHKHYIEQFAFSYFFQNTGRLNAADREVMHYWNFKEFRWVLDEFLRQHEGETMEEYASSLKKIHPDTLIHAKLKFERLPKLVRRFRERIKWTWEMPEWEA